jgi:acyl-CoA dehydrogenase
VALDPDTLEQLLETVARFVRERLVPNEKRLEDEDRVPPEIIAEMRELGLFGLSTPVEYGGLGLSMEDEVRVNFELGQTSTSFRALIATNNGIGSQAILIDGTEEQRRMYLPKLASGEIIGSFALTEPEAGSDAGSLRTTAKKDGDAYILDGTKRFITNAPEAGLFTVLARTGTQASGSAGISAFIVEAGTRGIRLGALDKKMGQRGAHTSDVIFEECRIPSSCLIGGPKMENQGFKTAMKVLDRGRLTMAATAVGVSERLIRESVRYASTRVQFGKPIGEFQLIQAMLADSKTEAYAARTMVIDAAKKRDRGEAVSMEASCAKYFATESVGRIADRAVQIFGGAGYIADYGIERFYRDVRLMRLYEGTSQIQQLIIARAMLKGDSERAR